MKSIFLIIFLFIFLFPLVSVGADKGEFEDNTVVKTVDGLKFRVPEDRPIEKKDGIIAPMEIDKYVAMKFLKAEERFVSIEESIKRIEEDLTLIKQELQSLKKSKTPK